MAVLFISAISFFVATGCKKKFDPNEFDAGAPAPSTVASGTAPAIDSSAATTADAGDGLAPLETGKAHTAAATGGGGAAKPKSDPAECAQARKFCNELPPAERHKPENQKQCTDFRFACFNKGGHL